MKQAEHTLTHQLAEYFSLLAGYPSTPALQKSLLFKTVRPKVEEVLATIEYGSYADEPAYQRKPFYRCVAWNVERGMKFAGILSVLKNHPEISKADLLYLTETDIGMARSQNKNIARELALALKMNYFFAPGYLNLTKGNSIEQHLAGDNLVGIHGNALLSRYPLENLRTIPLKNCKDKMRGQEKRLGCQTALVADVVFPLRKLCVVVAHLDAHSSQRQRAGQLKTILAGIKDQRHPVLLGGDLNTNCYNTRHAFFAFCGFWHKVFRGSDDVIKNHYPYPERYYDRYLFKAFEEGQFDYQSFNETGVGTLHYRVADIRGSHLVREVVPDWCRRIMENKLAKHGGRASLKLDWFAGKWLKPADATGAGVIAPKVIPDLEYEGMRVSDHDPILVDVDLYG